MSGKFRGNPAPQTIPSTQASHDAITCSLNQLTALIIFIKIAHLPFAIFFAFSISDWIAIQFIS